MQCNEERGRRHGRWMARKEGIDDVAKKEVNG